MMDGYISSASCNKKLILEFLRIMIYPYGTIKRISSNKCLVVKLFISTGLKLALPRIAPFLKLAHK